MPVRLEQLLRWPAASPSPYPNISAGPLLALGVAQPCAAVSGLFDKACSTVVYPHVLASVDGGHTWACLASNAYPVSTLHSAYVSYSSAESDTAAAIAAQQTGRTCNFVCVIGGQYADPGGTSLYGKGTRSVWCSTDGAGWAMAPDLPFPVVGGTAVMAGDHIVLIGGIRPAGAQKTHLRAQIDPQACGIGIWTVEPVVPNAVHAAMYDTILHWCASFPALPNATDCETSAAAPNATGSGWCHAGIGPSAVSFCTLGMSDPLLDGVDADTFSLAPLLQVSSRPILAHTVDYGATWKFTTANLPTAQLLQNAQVRGYRVRGNFDLPLPSFAVPNLAHRRPLLLAANRVAFLTVDDGKTWQPVHSVHPLRRADGQLVTMPASLLTGVARSLQHQDAFTLHLWDMFSDRAFMGHTRYCPSSCQADLGLPPDYYLSSPCDDSPWTAQCRRCTVCQEGVEFAREDCSANGDALCSPCTVCNATTQKVLVGCSLSRDTICYYRTSRTDVEASPLPIVPQPGAAVLYSPPAGAWVESVLYAAVLFVWSLFVFASGAVRMLCGAGRWWGSKGKGDAADGTPDGRTVSNMPLIELASELLRVLRFPASLGRAAHPAAPLALGLCLPLAYHALDMSLLIAAARLPQLTDEERQKLTAAGLLGSLSLLLLFAASVMRARSAKAAWLKARSAWVRALKAHTESPNCTPECGEQLTVADDRRLVQLQSAAASFALHPLSSLWYEAQVDCGTALAHSTVTHLAQGFKGAAHGSAPASTGNWGTVPARRLTRGWALTATLLADGCQVLACVIGAAVLQQGQASGPTRGSVLYGCLVLLPCMSAAVTWLAYGRGLHGQVGAGGMEGAGEHHVPPGSRLGVQDYPRPAATSTVDNPLGQASWRAAVAGVAPGPAQAQGVLPHLHKARVEVEGAQPGMPLFTPSPPSYGGPMGELPSSAAAALPAISIQASPQSVHDGVAQVGELGMLQYLPSTSYSHCRPVPLARRLDDGSVTAGTSRTGDSSEQAELDEYGAPVVPVGAQEGWSQLTRLLRSTRAERVGAATASASQLPGVEEEAEDRAETVSEQEYAGGGSFDDAMRADVAPQCVPAYEAGGQQQDAERDGGMVDWGAESCPSVYK